MSMCKVHNVRFYNPKVEGIFNMAFNKDTKKLAVSRSDASIEIWNLQCVSFIERTITPCSKNYSIEGLVWCGERLFSVGLHGLLVEYDLHRLCVKSTSSVTGQTAFCLDTNGDNSQIAVGTEEGYLNIFKVDVNGVMFEKFLDKQEGRILCLKYDKTGKFIVSGGLDAIRVWDVNTGHAIHRMTTGRSNTNKPTIIWCLAVTQDFTIISGDSRGKLTFWDGEVGSQIESYQSHRADILCLCINDDEKTLYCAGIDPNIMSYDKIYMKGENFKWVKSIQRRVHDHDVCALVLNSNKLFSGGTDGYLSCTYHPPKSLMKYPPILQNPCAIIASSSRIILLRYSNYVEVWQLGHNDDATNENYSMYLPLKNESKKLLVLQRIVKSPLGNDVKEGIVTCSISSDGQWIVFGTTSVLRLYNFDYKVDSEPTLNAIDNLPDDIGISVNSIFISDNKYLILASQNGDIHIVQLGIIPTIEQTLKTESCIKDTITFLICSPCNKYLIAGDPQSNIAVWRNNKNNWKFYCTLPKYSCPPTAINVQTSTSNVLIVYSDHKIVEYNLSEMKLTKFCRELNQHKFKWVNKNFTVSNITFDPRNDQIVILHDDSNIVVINKDKELSERIVKIAKIDSPVNGDDNTKPYSMNTIKKYKHLAHLGWLSQDEMVVVEVSPILLLEKLKPGFNLNRFGEK